jgi:hypothetical protein
LDFGAELQRVKRLQKKSGGPAFDFRSMAQALAGHKSDRQVWVKGMTMAEQIPTGAEWHFEIADHERRMFELKHRLSG